MNLLRNTDGVNLMGTPIKNTQKEEDDLLDVSVELPHTHLNPLSTCVDAFNRTSAATGSDVETHQQPGFGGFLTELYENCCLCPKATPQNACDGRIQTRQLLG